MSTQYKLVPIEPTEDMIDAGCDCEPATRWNTNGEKMRDQYQAMLNAAPDAPASGLSDEQILELSARFIPPVTRPRVRDLAIIDFARALLAAPQAQAEARDAARYRWLRDISEPGICAFYLSVGQAFHGVRFKRETVDEAIDAQIARNSTGEGS
ncbi:protein of unknown function [Pararobbsia alpina]|uniref:hypothetical protein n=1 Tax=Pararobbsia alpina TaxID=621374 RepID=UPI0039A42CDE